MRKAILVKQAGKLAIGTLCMLSSTFIFNDIPAMAIAPQTNYPSAMSVSQMAGTHYLQSQNWESSVKTTINEFLDLYGNRSANYTANNRPYAVFDFDNTTSIMDMEEQLGIWQLEHLAFAITPDQLGKILETGIPADKLNLTYGANDGEGRAVRLSDAIYDSTQAYASLYKKGLVSPNGRNLSVTTKNDPDYQEFTTKMRWLYDAIGETMDNAVSYPWITYWFTGMTPNQVYRLAYDCDSYYGNPAKGQTWTKEHFQSPADRSGRAGNVNVSFNQGITVTPEIKELYGALDKNGIDIWIDSASFIDVIRAAKDYFALPGVKGIVAMTNKLNKNGTYTNSYDYDFHAQTQGVGKAQTIDTVIRPKYQGQGPIFCAMDSQGDFNFCTEYKDTKAVLIMNRKRKDDAALCAAIAVWQKSQAITLQQANNAGDTKFLLQGRNENTGTLWADNTTLLLGKKENSYLSDKATNAIKQLDQGLSIKDVLQKDTKLKDYQGYKTR